jgi:enoyl-CoA hydratase/carnithine racemase
LKSVSARGVVTTENAWSYETVHVERSDGIVTLTLHSGDGPLVWNDVAHRELPNVFQRVALDRDARVVILTGTGNAFCERADFKSFANAASAVGWDTVFWEGRRLLQSLLDIEVPVVAAVNGPARVHAEVALLGDVVLCSEDAVFQDAAHFTKGIVAGDGVHVLWPMWLGPNRGRSFLLTGAEIEAREALSLGLVAEVSSAEHLQDRALQVAQQIAKHPPLVLRNSKVALVRQLRRLLEADLGYGLLLEGIAAISSAEDR